MKSAFVMLTLLWVVQLCPAQIESYVGEDPVGNEGYRISSQYTYAIKLPLAPQQLGFTLTAGEREQMNGLIADALTEALGKTVISIAAERIDELKESSAFVVVVNLASYRTSPDIMNQKRGTLMLNFAFFNNAASPKPVKELSVEATGSRHWGDSTPLMNAFEAMALKVRRIRLE